MVTPHTLAYGWISYVYKLTTLNHTDKLVLHTNTTHTSIDG